MPEVAIGGVLIGCLFLQLRGVREEAARLRKQMVQLKKALAITGVTLPTAGITEQSSDTAQARGKPVDRKPALHPNADRRV
jgi:hypothetical protein